MADPTDQYRWIAGTADTDAVQTLEDLATQLRDLRRRHVRSRRDGRLTYRELAGKTGWSHAVISDYFTGKVLAPPDRFDVLIQLLGATPAEVRALATTRDRVEESRRKSSVVGSPEVNAPVRVPTTSTESVESSAQLDCAIQHLGVAVSRQWSAEVEMLSLNRPAPLSVTVSGTTRPVGLVSAAQVTLVGGLGDVAVAFRRLPARQLVVLGEPGAGKSVLALMLTLGLLADRQAGEPIPVLLPLASWNPIREHLCQWVASRLLENYPGLANTALYGADAATRLVLHGMIIPVLDGLDELPSVHHAAAIDAIDRTMARRPFVVTCRSDEFERAVTTTGSVFTRATVAEIDPVDPETAVAFLTARAPTGDSRWTPVVEHLRRNPDGSLARALRTPLMVDLARNAYLQSDTQPAELCDTTRFATPDAIEAHLLDGFVSAAYTHHPRPPAQLNRAEPRRAYDPAQARRWLGFLARHLHRQRTRNLAWWHLELAVPKHVTALYLSLPVALLFAVTAWLAAGPIMALLFGLSFAIAGWVAHSTGHRPGPFQARRLVRPNSSLFLRRCTLGVGCGVAYGLAWSLPVEILMLQAAVFGSAFGLPALLDKHVDANQVTSPAAVLRADRNAAWTYSLSFVLALGVFYGICFTVPKPAQFVIILDGRFSIVLALVGGVAAGSIGRFLLGRPGGIAYGIAGVVINGQVHHTDDYLHAVLIGALFGFSVGLAVCLARAWGTYTATRLWLALRGQLPLRLTHFLNDAHRRGILRLNGATYQFRHAGLQDSLAAQ